MPRFDASNQVSPVVIKDQPTPIPEPTSPAAAVRSGILANQRAIRTEASRIKRKFTTRQGWLGDYDYAWYETYTILTFSAYFDTQGRLCTPSLPFMARKRRPPPFYALDAELPLVLAIASGLQHALAMLAGLITPPIIFASTLNLDNKTSSYLISASLIGCGMFSIPSRVIRERSTVLQAY